MSTQSEAKQVPLAERLEDVPADARLAVDDGPHSTSYYPIGKMAHEAADQLRRLHSVNAELLWALQNIAATARFAEEFESDWCAAATGMVRMARAAIRAAIAKAEEVKP